jgi:hypothetical protein
MSDEEQPQQQDVVEPQAITPGTVIAPTVTIDAIFTALYATRSADLVAAGTPIYSWGKDNMIIAQWPTLQVGASPAVPNYSAMFATFHARSDLARGSSIAQ